MYLCALFILRFDTFVLLLGLILHFPYWRIPGLSQVHTSGLYLVRRTLWNRNSTWAASDDKNTRADKLQVTCCDAFCTCLVFFLSFFMCDQIPPSPPTWCTGWLNAPVFRRGCYTGWRRDNQRETGPFSVLAVCVLCAELGHYTSIVLPLLHFNVSFHS